LLCAAKIPVCRARGTVAYYFETRIDEKPRRVLKLNTALRFGRHSQAKCDIQAFRLAVKGYKALEYKISSIHL